MSNIDFLTSEANRLEQSFNSWNHSYIVLVILTAVITGLLVLFTSLVKWTASRKAVELGAINKKIIRLKDEQLADEFNHRDERIAQVKADADLHIAEVKAGSDQKLAAANRRSDEISAESNRKAEELRRQNLDTASKLVAAERALEAEHVKRLEMEAWLAPRVLEQSPKILGDLNKFSGIEGNRSV